MIAQEIAQCQLCPLHQRRTQTVPGEGSATATLMLIGEAPGFHEDRQGRPFVGASGQFLTQLLQQAGFRREDVFIANVVKCRPPQNRDPADDEIIACTTNYLYRQIDAINPAVLVTLGRFSLNLFLPGTKISRVHGQPHMVNGRLIVPIMHPAAALHQPTNRPLIEEDFRRLPEMIAEIEQERNAVIEQERNAVNLAAATVDVPKRDNEQLSMF